MKGFLHLRGDTYYFRCRVPHDLYHIFTQREAVKSLHTRDKRMAKDATGEWYCRTTRIFNLWREKSYDEVTYSLELALDVIGNITTCQLSPEINKSFLATILLLPANHRKKPALRDLKVSEIIKLDGNAPMNWLSIRMLSQIHSLLLAKNASLPIFDIPFYYLFLHNIFCKVSAFDFGLM